MEKITKAVRELCNQIPEQEECKEIIKLIKYY